ncbi:chymotrypsin inhibitor-like [Pyxicephalus adspersus]|uniref:chymotrypsin inhibitor-like n=1 Tax=Pyxicephalus adspersus TaxID=30357 RepID=UPI003B5BD480
MKVRVILLLCSLVVCVSLIGKASGRAAPPADGCPDNEEFVTCGSKCLTSCRSRDIQPLACDRRCFIGCDCKRGFLRNSAGSCVQEQDCN